jgi:serine/threonine protein kinase
VAVKVPKAHGVAELKGEVESLSPLTHVNVVQILGMFQGESPGSTETHWKMAEEFCDTDLKNLLYVAKDKDGKDIDGYRDYTTELMVNFAEQIVTGLEYIHGQKKCHLDLKPENIMLSKDGGTDWVCKIGDFGMEYKKDDDGGRLDKIVPYGTWEYMPPESWKRKYGEPGFASDIFSFGLMLWEMIARSRIYKALPGVADIPNADGSANTAAIYSQVAARMLSGGMAGHPTFDVWGSGQNPDGFNISANGGASWAKNTADAKFIHCVELSTASPLTTGSPYLEIRGNYAGNFEINPNDTDVVLVSMDIELVSGAWGGARLQTEWRGGNNKSNYIYFAYVNIPET